MSTTSTLSPNMELTLPIINLTPDPAWAQDLLLDLNTIDSHNHIPGSGVQVPTAGININANLPFNNFSLTNLSSVDFIGQGSTLTIPSSIYTFNGNLYYTNASGVPVQITSGSSVNVSGTGGFQGDYITSNAVAYFNNTANLYFYTNSSGIYSAIQGSSQILTNPLGNSVTLEPDASLATNLTLVLPSALPSVTTPVTLSSGGLLSTSLITTSFISPQAVTAAKIANNTITSTQIANGTITATQIANNTITATQLAALNIQTSPGGGASITTTSSSLTFTGNALSITSVAGRSIMVILQSAGGAFASYIGAQANSAGNNASMQLVIQRNGSTLVRYDLGVNSSFFNNTPPAIRAPLSSCYFVDTTATGIGTTYTYAVYIAVTQSNNTAEINNASLVVYEIM